MVQHGPLRGSGSRVRKLPIYFSPPPVALCSLLGLQPTRKEAALLEGFAPQGRLPHFPPGPAETPVDPAPCPPTHALPGPLQPHYCLPEEIWAGPCIWGAFPLKPFWSLAGSLLYSCALFAPFPREEQTPPPQGNPIHILTFASYLHSHFFRAFMTSCLLFFLIYIQHLPFPLHPQPSSFPCTTQLDFFENSLTSASSRITSFIFNPIFPAENFSFGCFVHFQNCPFCSTKLLCIFSTLLSVPCSSDLIFWQLSVTLCMDYSIFFSDPQSVQKLFSFVNFS